MVNTPATPPHGERAHEAAELQGGIVLRITHASGKRRQLHAIDACTTFGTSSDCTVQLSDSDVLPLHATLVQNDQHAVLRGHDIPLVVNNIETAEAALTEGDTFQLGSYTIEVLRLSRGRSAAHILPPPQAPPESPTRRLSFARSFRPVARRSFRTDSVHGSGRPASYFEPAARDGSAEHAELFSRFDSLAEKLGEVASAFEADRSRVRDAEQLEAARQTQQQLERRIDELKQKAAELQAAVDESQQEARAEKQHGLQLAADLQKTRELLEAARADQENQKLSWENETAGMQLHLETMSAELAQTQARCSDFEAARADAQRRIDQLEADARRLRLQLKRTSAETEAATKQEKDARQKHQSLKDELAAVRNQLSKAEQERDAAQRDCKQHAAQLADHNALQRQFEQQASEAAKELEQAKARLAQTQGRLAAVTGKLDDATSQNASLREEQQKAEQRRKAEVERHAERLRTLTSERDAAQENCRAAEKKSAETDARIEALQSEVQRLNDRLTAGTQQLAEASQLQQQSQSAREQLQTQLTQTQEELRDSQSMLDELQQQLIAANKELNEARAQVQETAEREATAIRDLESTKNQLADACETIVTLQNRETLEPADAPDQPVTESASGQDAGVGDEPYAGDAPHAGDAPYADDYSYAGHEPYAGDAPYAGDNSYAGHEPYAGDAWDDPVASDADDAAVTSSGMRSIEAVDDADAFEEPVDAPQHAADGAPAGDAPQWDQEDGSDEWPSQQAAGLTPPENLDEATELPDWYSAAAQNLPESEEEAAAQDPWQNDVWQDDSRQDDSWESDSQQDDVWQEDPGATDSQQDDAWQDESRQDDVWQAPQEGELIDDEAMSADLQGEDEPRFESSEEVMARLRRMVGVEADGSDEDRLEADAAEPVAAEEDAAEAKPLDPPHPRPAEPAKAKATKQDEADDESIESYMKRLLARVQGRDEEEEPAPAPPTVAKTPAASSRNDANAASDDASTDENEQAFIPRAAPEKTHDLAAMRELANTSARSAIRSSVRRRRWAAAGSKMAISFVALATSFGLTLFSGFKFGFLVILAGCFLTVAIVWGADAMLTIQRMTRDTAEKEK